MKNKSTLIILSIAFVTFSHSAISDTFQSFLSDAVNDIQVTSKAGACNANPYILKSISGYPYYKQAIAPCVPTVVSCPTGLTAVPGLPGCTRTANAASDPTIVALLQATYGNYGNSVSNFGNPLQVNKINSTAASDVMTGYKCNANSNNYFNNYFAFGTSVGYTPYCFLDLSKIQTLAKGAQRYFQPSSPYINGTVVSLQDNAGN